MNRRCTLQLRCHTYVDRWYSIEYDWFYLESLATNFIFRASSSAAGDVGDMVNWNPAVSRVNGSPFVTSGTACTSGVGPWWYSAHDHCCYFRLFGASHGFWWNGTGNLKAARMMIRMVQ